MSFRPELQYEMSGCFKNDDSLSLTVSKTKSLPRLLGVLLSRAFLYRSDL